MKFPFQGILEDAEPSVEFLDLTDLPEASQVAKLDELFQGAGAERRPGSSPVLSATLVALAPTRYAALINLPAMSADTRSLEIIAKELGELLGGEQSNRKRNRCAIFSSRSGRMT